MAEPDLMETLEMGITHQDFHRLFPRAVPPGGFTVAGNRIAVPGDGRRVEITLGEEKRRPIGPTLAFPVTMVELAFSGYSEAEKAAFMERFHLAFQRGGG